MLSLGPFLLLNLHPCSHLRLLQNLLMTAPRRLHLILLPKQLEGVPSGAHQTNQLAPLVLT